MKIFCPNFSNIETSRQFKQLSAIFGEPEAYLIWHTNNGHGFQVLDNGKPNTEFLNLAENIGTTEAIKQYWKTLPRRYYTDEMQQLLQDAKRDKDGNLLAPNGKPSNLTEEQWLTVRTKAFKDWFGDWETANRFNIQDIDLSRVDIEETSNKDEHEGNKTLKIYLKNQHEKGWFELVKDREFSQYSVHLKTDKSKLQKGDTKILFEELSNAIPDGAIVSTWGSLSDDGIRALSNNIGRGMEKIGERDATRKSDNSNIKIPIFQKTKGVSKIVDENGEPLVVYHYTEEKFDTFSLKFFGKTDPGDSGRGFYVTPHSPESDTNGYFRGEYGDTVSKVYGKGQKSEFLKGRTQISSQELIKHLVQNPKYTHILSGLKLIKNSQFEKFLKNVTIDVDHSFYKSSTPRAAIIIEGPICHIIIKANAFYDNGNPDDVLMHEIFHGLLASKIATYKDAQNDIQNIINIYNKHYKSDNRFKGVDALDEFMANLWTDPVLIQRLQNINSEKLQNKSLWDRIIEIFNKILSLMLGRKADKSLYTEASMIMYDLLSSPLTFQDSFATYNTFYESVQDNISATNPNVNKAVYDTTMQFMFAGFNPLMALLKGVLKTVEEMSEWDNWYKQIKPLVDYQVNKDIPNELTLDKFNEIVTKWEQLALPFISKNSGIMLSGKNLHEIQEAIDNFRKLLNGETIDTKLLGNNKRKLYQIPDDKTKKASKKSPYNLQITKKDWTRKEVAKDTDTLYIFTDNTDRSSGSKVLENDPDQGIVNTNSVYYKKYGEGEELRYPTQTQAVIRGLDNAFPISTQHWYHEGAKGVTGRWTDDDIDEFTQVVEDELKTIVEAWKTGKYKSIKVGEIFDENISQINQKRTPKLYQKLIDLLKKYSFDELIPGTSNKKESKKKKRVKVNDDTLKDFTLHSGGAKGADIAWSYAVEEFNADAHHYYIVGMKDLPPHIDLKDLGVDDFKAHVSLKMQKDASTKMAEVAQRMYNFHGTKMNNPLILRNYAQVAFSSAVYAVGTIAAVGERVFPNIPDDDRIAAVPTVTGGTGYATNLAIMQFKPVFVFNQSNSSSYKKGWYRWSHLERDFIPIDESEVILSKNFAGIGTRELTEVGRAAINSVVYRTRTALQNGTYMEPSLWHSSEYASLDEERLEILNKLFDDKKSEQILNLERLQKEAFKNHDELAYKQARHRIEFFHQNDLTSVDLQMIGEGLATSFIQFFQNLFENNDIYFITDEYPDIFDVPYQSETRQYEHKYDYLKELYQQNKIKNIVQIINTIGTKEFIQMVIDDMKNNIFNQNADILFNSLDSYLDCYLDIANNVLRECLGIQLSMNETKDAKTEQQEEEDLLESIDSEVEDNDIMDGLEDNINDFLPKDQKTIPYLKSVDKEVKYYFRQFIKRDVLNGFTPECNKWGFNCFYTYSHIMNKLNQLCYSAVNESKMLELIEQSELPFRTDLLNLLRSNPQLRTKVWVSVRTSRNKFIKFRHQTKTKMVEGEATTVTRMQIDDLTPYDNKLDSIDKAKATATLWNNGNCNTLYAFLDYGNNNKPRIFVNQQKLNGLKQSIKMLLNIPFLQRLHPVDEDVFVDQLTKDVNVYDLTYRILTGLGFDFALEEVMSYINQHKTADRVFSTKPLRDLLFMCDKILSDQCLNQDKFMENGESDPFQFKSINLATRYYNIYTTLAPFKFEEKDGCVWANNKQYSIASPLNFIQKICQRLQIKNYSYDEIKQFVEEQYGNSVFTERAVHAKPNVDSNFFTLFFKNDDMGKSFRENFGFNTLATSDGIDYMSLTPLQYVENALKCFSEAYTTYANDKSHAWTRYMLPVLADKSTIGTLTLPLFKRVGSNAAVFVGGYQTNSRQRGLFLTAVEQELDRMRNAYLRAKYGAENHKLRNYETILDENGNVAVNKTAINFYFFPCLNKFLSQINDENACLDNKIVAYFHDRIYGTDEQNITEEGQTLPSGLLDYNDTRSKYYSDDFSLTLAAEIEAEIGNEIRTMMDVNYMKWVSALKKKGWYKTLRQEMNYHSNEPTTDHFDSLLHDFYWNQYYANFQVFELLTSDICFYKHTDDIQKRIAEFVSPGLAHSTEAQNPYSDNNYFAQDAVNQTRQRIIIAKDTKYASVFLVHIQKVLEDKAARDIEYLKQQKNLSPEELERRIHIINLRTEKAIRSYNKIDGTDGQGFISLDYVYKALGTLGRASEFEPVYRWLKTALVLYRTSKRTDADKARLRQSASDCLSQYPEFAHEVMKQFTYTMIPNPANTALQNDKRVINTPFQIKNAQYSLLDIITICQSGDSTLLDLLCFMDENQIDAFYFESNCKVGHNGLVDPTNKTSQEFFDYLHTEIRKPSNPYVYDISMTDVVLQQETPQHYFEHECALGIQLRKLVHNVIVDQIIGADGKLHDVIIDNLSAKDFRNRFERLLEHKIDLALQNLLQNKFKLSDAIIQKLSNPESVATLTNEERLQINSRISTLMRENFAASGNNRVDELFGISLDENGNFNVSTADPLQFKKFEKYIISLIKKTILDCKTPGGQLVQVTDDFRLNVNRVAAADIADEIQLDDSLQIKYYRKDGSVTNKASEGVRIAWFEAEMPVCMATIFQHYVKDNGEVDMERLKLDCPEALEIIGYRIPTEGYCSMFPIKIVRFSNKVAGGIIKLPREITNIGGMDFDIDKLFFAMNECKWDKQLKRLRYVEFDYDIQNLTDAQTNNAILHHVKTVLTSEYALPYQLMPSSFTEITTISRQSKVFREWRKEHKNAKVEEVLAKWKEIENKTDSDLESEINMINGNKNICAFETQEELFNRNSQSTAEIGICANASSSHSYLKHFHLTVHHLKEFILNGNAILSEKQPIDPVYAFDGVTFVSQNISQFLAAAVDGIKCPDLEGINFNTFTINIGLTLVRLGFDIKTVGLFLQQPIIYKFDEFYRKSIDNKIAKGHNFGKVRGNMRYVNKQINKLCKSIIGDSKAPNKAFTNEDLICALEMSLEAENIKEVKQEGSNFSKQQLYLQVQIAQIVQPLLKLSEEMMLVTKAIKVDAKTNVRYQSIFDLWGDDASIESYLESLKEVDPKTGKQTCMMDKRFLDIFDPTKDIYSPVLTQTRLQTRRLSNIFFNYLNPQLVHFYDTVVPLIKQFYYGNKASTTIIKSDMIKQMFYDWMLFLAMNEEDNLLSNNIAQLFYYAYTFPTKALQLIQELRGNPKYQNNELLRALETVSYQDHTALTLDSLGRSKENLEKIRVDWEEMYYQDDERISQLAKELWVYNLYRTGFKFGMKSFSYLFSNIIKSELPKYNTFWNTLHTTDLSTKINQFGELYIRNNPNVAYMFDEAPWEADPNTISKLPRYFQFNGITYEHELGQSDFKPVQRLGIDGIIKCYSTKFLENDVPVSFINDMDANDNDVDGVNDNEPEDITDAQISQDDTETPPIDPKTLFNKESQIDQISNEEIAKSEKDINAC